MKYKKEFLTDCYKYDITKDVSSLFTNIDKKEILFNKDLIEFTTDEMIQLVDSIKSYSTISKSIGYLKKYFEYIKIYDIECKVDWKKDQLTSTYYRDRQKINYISEKEYKQIIKELSSHEGDIYLYLKFIFMAFYEGLSVGNRTRNKSIHGLLYLKESDINKETNIIHIDNKYVEVSDELMDCLYKLKGIVATENMNAKLDRLTDDSIIPFPINYGAAESDIYERLRVLIRWHSFKILKKQYSLDDLRKSGMINSCGKVIGECINENGLINLHCWTDEQFNKFVEVTNKYDIKMKREYVRKFRQQYNKYFIEWKKNH